MATNNPCTICGKPGIPGLARGQGKCQYHWNVGAFGEKWADEVEQRKAAKITKKDIPEIARQAGLQVVSEKNGAFVDICRKGRKTPTIRIWQDGSINRADVELHLCKAMTIAETLEALGLKV